MTAQPQPAAEIEPQQKRERDEQVGRGQQGRPEADQQGDGAQTVHGEEEGRHGIERADALARAALFLLVIDPLEIAHQEREERSPHLRFLDHRIDLRTEA